VTSLRGRLVIGTVAAVALAFVGVGVAVMALTRSTLDAQFDEALVSNARELAAQVEEDDGKITSEIDPHLLANNEAFEVWAGDRVLASTPGTTLVPGADLATADIVLGDRPARQITLKFAPRREPGELDERNPPAGTAVLAFARTTAEVDTTTARIRNVLIAVGLAGVALCVGLLFLIVRFGLAPVRQLAATIAEIREDDLSVRLADATTAAELAPVAERLDELLARLGAAFARERELTAEIAHELRTPLGGLRAQIEVALDRERPADRYRAALVECLAITRQTEGVVEALLSLARLDSGQATVTAAPVDVDQLVRDVLAAAHARAKERELDIVTELEPITRSTDRDKLRVVIANLVDNAVAYADAGGEIHVALAGNVLRVSNTGCTLTADQVTRVFERFWRADASRTTNGHVGLGLPLCKKLVELLGGTITADVQGGRFIATVVLPS
jgi:two-component system sensor histidine kinase QseC